EKYEAALRQQNGAKDRWESVYRQLTGVFSLASIEEHRGRLEEELAALEQQPGQEAFQTAWLGRLREAVRASAAGALLARGRGLAEQADRLGAAMDFRFLYKPDRHLFAIGYQVSQKRLDTPSYDLLASEARLASFLAVARGEAPRRHWFYLGRPITRV